jgi:hypothetical protein
MGSVKYKFDIIILINIMYIYALPITVAAGSKMNRLR